jgi:RHS repeat-associated protein
MSVPIATSPGRSGFGPQLSLSYDSGAGNGPFGFGWGLSLPSISRKTDKGLPKYQDAAESDVFVVSGAEDLVPVFRQDPDGSWIAAQRPELGFHRETKGWVRDASGRLVVHEDEFDGYRVRHYRPRIEGLFARIERWSKIGSQTDVHWRSISKDNILTLFGYDENSRIADPLDASRIFSWLICESRDDKGNGVRYLYKKEDGACQLRPNQLDPFKQAHQSNRGNASDPRRKAQRYVQRVLYANAKPLLNAQGQRPRHLSDLPDPPTDTGADWLFEVRFDYGELDRDDPTGQPEKSWLYRPDAFSSYRAGFDVRTCRRCERVLMLHHIPDEPAAPDRSAQPGYRGVVRSTEFVYDDELDTSLVTKPIYSFLKHVTQTGWYQADGSATRRSLPPVEFEYTEPIVQQIVEEVDRGSLENLPIGLDERSYRWTDLHGEGISGILTEQAGAWYYKRNLSPIPTKLPDGSETVKAKLAPLEKVALKPNVPLSSGATFMDLAGDGQPDVVVIEGPTPGLYEHDEAEGWQPFRPFTSRLNRDLHDPNLKFVDLDGDGHADVLITEDDAFVWHASLAEEGFDSARRVARALDEEKGPRIVFADGTQSIYLADLSGDGLTDIVRIRNGEVCYWPNLGYGRFGAKVTMDNAPFFDQADQFHQTRIRVADIDGSGTTDIIYLHRDGVRLYFNQSGNGWSAPQALKVFPRIDDLSSIVPTDLLGNGTACLVWSSPLPGDTRRPMRYVNLMGGRKPHLLVKTVNNLGAETRVHYAPSTKFYLQHKRDGKPWITRLPFPVHVVERVETHDLISRNLFVTCYAYHHGYFDGAEREFRGFGMVEQWDTEAFGPAAGSGAAADNIAAASHVPPVHTKTWFHTGAYLGRDRITHQFEHEYFREPELDIKTARQLLLDDKGMPPGLDPEEEREACRALKGSMLRQEVYALDGVGQSADYPSGKPYVVAEQNFTVRALQPRSVNRHAVFFTHAREAISYHYERKPADPRTQHTLTLKVDEYGNVLKQVAVAYGRREPDGSLPDADQAKQALVHITYTSNGVSKAITDQADHYRTPLPADSRTYELRRSEQEASAGGLTMLRRFDELLKDVEQAEDGNHDIDYEDINFARAQHAVADNDNEKNKYFRRLVEHVRTLYRKDDLTGLLPLSDLQSLALPGESYKLAFSPGLLDQMFLRGDQALIPDLTQVLPVDAINSHAADRGVYVDLDGNNHWWVPSGRTFLSPNAGDSAAQELAYARQHFFLPLRYRTPFHTDGASYESTVRFDANDLLMVETRDALDNRVTVDANDYRVLQPRVVSDANRNQTEVAFDALGMVAGTAVMGKADEDPLRGDKLDDLFQPDPTQDQIDGFMEQPREPSPDRSESVATQIVHNLLGSATTRIVYDLTRYMRLGEPPFAATIARETHIRDLPPGQKSKLQLSFSYSDGFGREIQKKIQAEAGPLVEGGPVVSPRWVGSGWTIFNNKAKPVRRFEPFFSVTHKLDSDVRIGVSPWLFYDPVGRVVATLHPNHTWEKIVFDSWQQRTFDVNDTVLIPVRADDPNRDAEVAGYFERLPDAEYLPTWHELRTDPVHAAAFATRFPDDVERGNETTAAEKASAHAETPTTKHFDSLGRPFLTLVCNRVVCTDHPLNSKPDEAVATHVELDIEGNQREVLDERKLPDAANLPLGALEQRVVMQYAYDMLGNRIHQQSMEAGARWMLNDVDGKPIRAWNSRGYALRTEYDQLRRPLRRFVTGANPDDPGKELLTERLVYGEQHPQAEQHNLRVKVYLHLDQAGVAGNEAHDFKGNLLSASRRIAGEYKRAIDWRAVDDDHAALPLDAKTSLDVNKLNAALAPYLGQETFANCTRYDAFNSPVQSVAPHSDQPGTKRNVIQPRYSEANLLDRIDVWLQRMDAPAALLDANTDAPSPVGLANTEYDARGQRTRIDYKTQADTVIRTSYAYDRETFRLKRLYTRRGVSLATGQGGAFSDDCGSAPTFAAPEQPPAGTPCGLQNLRYSYDPTGNITAIRDDAQQTIYFRNQRVEPSNDYIYDALYRLVQATGREHLGQGGTPIPHSYNDAGRAGIVSANPPGRFAPNEVSAMGTYTERYIYDAVGNLLRMQHKRADAALQGWTRIYAYGEASLIEPDKHSNRLTRTTIGTTTESYSAAGDGYDPHGNMLHMPQLQVMQWDHRDQLQMSQRQKVNDEDADGNERHGERTWYVYDAAGQRVRKVTELANGGGLKDERIYLGGFEIYRCHSGNHAGLRRETLHLMDDKQRIALVETRNGVDDGNLQQLIRYQFGNHLGSSRLELDEHAQIISYEEYAPYGSSTYQAVRSQTETAKRYRYTGKERDEESGLYYHGARYFATSVGRWVSADPGGLVDGPNLFCYVGGNPVKLVDPSGRQSERTQPEYGHNPASINPTKYYQSPDQKLASRLGAVRDPTLAAQGRPDLKTWDSQFEGPRGEQFRANVQDAAKEMGVDPGLLAANALAEVDTREFWLNGAFTFKGTTTTARRSDVAGLDFWVASQTTVKAAVPAAKGINASQVGWFLQEPQQEELKKIADAGQRQVFWEKHRLPVVGFADAKTALRALAAMTKFHELQLQKLVGAEAWGRFTDAERFALIRFSFNAGPKAVKKPAAQAAAGEDILVRSGPMRVPVPGNPMGRVLPSRAATIIAAQAIHLSDTFFGNHDLSYVSR